MAVYKEMRLVSQMFNLPKGWIRVPFNVDLKVLWQEFKNTQSPTYPPQTLDEAEALLNQFALWCSSAKGYDVFLEQTVYV